MRTPAPDASTPRWDAGAESVVHDAVVHEIVEERRASIGGRSLRYLVAGSGRPLLLCHGFLSSGEEFGGRFLELARERQLIMPDLPGNGASQTLRSGHTAAAMAAVLAELLAQLGVDELDVAGLCLGGSVACALAQLLGDRVGRMVLHTPLIAPGLVRRRYRAQVRLVGARPLWALTAALSHNRLVSDIYKRHVVREGDVDARTATANFDNQRRADPWAAREWLLDGLAREDTALLAQRTAPTLLIVAGADQMIDVRRIRRLCDELPRLELFVDEAQGHGWNAAAVARQLGVLHAFLECAAPAM